MDIVSIILSFYTATPRASTIHIAAHISTAVPKYTTTRPHIA